MWLYVKNVILALYQCYEKAQARKSVSLSRGKKEYGIKCAGIRDSSAERSKYQMPTCMMQEKVMCKRSARPNSESYVIIIQWLRYQHR